MERVPATALEPQCGSHRLPRGLSDRRHRNRIGAGPVWALSQRGMFPAVDQQCIRVSAAAGLAAAASYRRESNGSRRGRPGDLPDRGDDVSHRHVGGSQGLGLAAGCPMRDCDPQLSTAS